MTDGKSLVDLGKLSQPATTLIEKISDAIGVWYEPRRMVKQAQAQAHVDLIKFNSARQLSELEQRAMESFVAREAKKQDNIERITANAINSLSTDSEPEEISSDWLSYFFSKCEYISEPEMQRVWGEILARKASDATEYTRKTIEILSILESADAESFISFCAYAVFCKNTPELYIFDTASNFYREKDVNFGASLHLQTLGLITYHTEGYSREISADLKDDDNDEDNFSLPMQYFDQKLEIIIPKITNGLKNDDLALNHGQVCLTTAGMELLSICNAKSDPRFLAHWRNLLKKEGWDLIQIL